MNRSSLVDFLTGKKVESYYEIYNKSQWYSKSEVEEYQLKKLKLLISHCYKYVPYYRKYMHEHGIMTQNIKTVEDVKLFPILTKEIIKANYNEFIPLNISSIKGVKTGQTGGTTGNILFNRTDANTRSSTWATYRRFSDWMSVKQSDLKLILMGGHVVGKNYYDSVKQFVNNLITNSTSFNPYDTSQENEKKIISTLEKKKIVLIRSYTQFLFNLCNKLKYANRFFKVKVVTTTAEPLTDLHRNIFKEIFEANSFDQYGCGEIGGVAYECDHHKGLHISFERVILEINQNNELIITDLDNYAMPLIRYWNADQAILTEEECTCGRTGKIIKKIMGRTCDYVIGLSGEFLHWAYFWHLLFDSQIARKKDLRKFQVVQMSRDLIILRLVCKPLERLEVDLISSNIRQRLGNISIEFKFEDDIENAPSGKYRPVINNLINSKNNIFSKTTTNEYFN
jgi:phenylacetate-CoA ligase